MDLLTSVLKVQQELLGLLFLLILRRLLHLSNLFLPLQDSLNHLLVLLLLQLPLQQFESLLILIIHSNFLLNFLTVFCLLCNMLLLSFFLLSPFLILIYIIKVTIIIILRALISPCGLPQLQKLSFLDVAIVGQQLSRFVFVVFL